MLKKIGLLTTIFLVFSFIFPVNTGAQEATVITINLNEVEEGYLSSRSLLNAFVITVDNVAYEVSSDAVDFNDSRVKSDFYIVNETRETAEVGGSLRISSEASGEVLNVISYSGRAINFGSHLNTVNLTYSIYVKSNATQEVENNHGSAFIHIGSLNPVCLEGIACPILERYPLNYSFFTSIEPISESNGWSYYSYSKQIKIVDYQTDKKDEIDYIPFSNVINFDFGILTNSTSYSSFLLDDIFISYFTSDLGNQTQSDSNLITSNDGEENNTTAVSSTEASANLTYLSYLSSGLVAATIFSRIIRVKWKK